MVTNAIPTQQYVTGGEIVNLGALIAEMQRQGQLAAQEQAGYYSAGSLGPGAFNPTLAREQLNLQGELGRGNLALGQGQLALGRDQLGLDRELGFGNLALGRDQLNAAIAEAQRNYQLDLQRFGLDVANFNYNQRLGEATVRLEQLGLLSSLRGPSDYLAHNYVLNNMAAPQGQQVDPFQMSAGLNQQYTAPPMPNVPQPPPTTMYNSQMQQKPSAPVTMPQPTTSRPPTTNALAQPRAVPPVRPGSSGAISGNPTADAQLKASSAWAGAPPEIQAEFDRISQNMQDTYARAVAKNPSFQLYASGGMSPGGIAMVGDQESGEPTGHEELVISEGPFQVIPLDDIAAHQGGQFPGMGNWMQRMGQWGQQGQNTQWPNLPQMPQQVSGWMGQRPQFSQGNLAGFGDSMRTWAQSFPFGQMGSGNWSSQVNQGGGNQVVQQHQTNTNTNQSTPSTQPMPNMPQMPQFMQGLQSWLGQRPQPQQGNMQGFGDSMRNWAQSFPIPRAATGGSFTGANGTGDGQGFFNFNTYQPQDSTNAPFVQQTLGNMENPAFQQRGQPLGPFGAQPFSYSNYLGLLPSAREMLKGYIETPQAMGGLGSDWMDELERSRRAAATGVSFGPTQYQR